MFEGWFSRQRGERSVLGSRMQIRGTITSGGELEIRGRVEGNIEHAGRLVVAPGGTCFSNIRADEVQVAGEVRGNIEAEDLLELMPTARLYGDIACRSLRIHPGAVFLGTTRMVDAVVPAPAPAPLLAAPAPAPAPAGGGAQALPLVGALAVLCEPISGEERRELLRTRIYDAARPESEPEPEPEPDPEPPADRAPAFYGGFYSVQAARGQG